MRFLTYSFAIFLMTFSGITLASSTSRWSLNDVSVLLGLPTTTDTLLRPSTVGSLGELFPKELLNKIGILSIPSDRGSQNINDLRALAFRLDPCPAKPSRLRVCEPELRIVWQPVFKNKVWTTEDVAIHAFYALDASQYSYYKEGMQRIKSLLMQNGLNTNFFPLQIHPAYSQEHTREIFEKQFQKLIMETVGEQNIYKFTFMKLLVAENWWKFFAGYEKADDLSWKKSSIAEHGGFEMDIINDATIINPNSGYVDEVDASIFILPAFPKEDDIRRVVSTGFRKTMYSSEPHADDYEQFKIVLKAVATFQNPKLSNPNTINCVNCHYADTTYQFTKNVFPDLEAEFMALDNQYRNPDPLLFNEKNSSVALKTSRAVRAFGYFHDEPCIMTRTIFDSMESAHYINAEERSAH